MENQVDMSETAVTSFIVRFIQDQDAAEAPWRGVIRHVQHNEEIRFTRIEEALAFMSGYIDLQSADQLPEAPQAE